MITESYFALSASYWIISVAYSRPIATLIVCKTIIIILCNLYYYNHRDDSLSASCSCFGDYDPSKNCRIHAPIRFCKDEFMACGSGKCHYISDNKFSCECPPSEYKVILSIHLIINGSKSY